MKLSELVKLLNATVYTTKTYNPDRQVNFAFSCDLMSDALMMLRNVPLEFCEEGILSTGLVTIQGVRTAEMLDVKVVLLVRDKKPTDQVVLAAEENDIIMLGTSYTMFSSNGKMYEAGIKGISEI
ncbi:MAG: hypothetical protein PHO86_00465 [Bacilli bacterium]|nr:hypothetical protein [Bacilli bacterium]